MISERPAEAADRAVPGHWEGDLIIGKDCKSAVDTLVERATRYVLLLHLPAGRGAEDVEAAMRQAITTPPGELFRTITWDQGKEMAYHVDLLTAAVDEVVDAALARVAQRPLIPACPHEVAGTVEALGGEGLAVAVRRSKVPADGVGPTRG